MPVRAGTSCSTQQRQTDRSRGFSIIELLTGLTLLIILGVIFSAVLSGVITGSKREEARSGSVNSARSSLDMISNTMRTTFVQFCNYPGVHLGVNLDLDEGKKPVLRDGLYFFVDSNQTAILYPAGESSQPETAGFDDEDGDGQPDVVGFGLVAQDDDGDGVQDFADVDMDGKPDDFDLNRTEDRFWRLVMVRFDSPAQVNDVEKWKAGRTLAANVFYRTEQGQGKGQNTSAEDIDTFQFFSTDSSVMSYDKDGSGELDEGELGSIVTGGGKIDHVTEMAAIDGIRVNLHVAAARKGQRDKLSIYETVAGKVIPRAITLFRRNALVGLADPTLAKNVDVGGG